MRISGCRVLAGLVVLAFLACLATGCGSGAKSTDGESSTPQVALPSVIGLTESGARSVIEREGFSAGSVTSEEVSDTGEPTVLRQTPAAGSMAGPGDRVDFVMSIPATETVKVPEVSHSGTIARAPSTLRDAGLEVEVVEVTDAAARGKVVRQAPVAGSDVPAGTVVKIYISKGK